MRRLLILILLLTLGASAQTVSVPLQQGWNGLGVQGTFVTAAEANSQAPGLVFYGPSGYSGTQTADASALQAAASTGQACWIYATAATTFRYTARPATGPQTLGLQRGWNLVSFPSTPTGVVTGPNVSPFAYEIDGTRYTQVDLGNVRPGKACWVFATQAATLTWGGGSTPMTEAVSLPIPEPPVGPDVVVDYPSSGQGCRGDLVDSGQSSTQALIQTGQRWPNGSTLSVLFVDGLDVPLEVYNRVAQLVIYNYSAEANLRFHFYFGTPETAAASGQTFHIRVKFLADEGYKSYIGTGSLGKPVSMFLSRLHQEPLDSSQFRRVVLHEFGHALGLYHELQSPEAQAAVTWNRAELVRAYTSAPRNWTAQMVEDYILKVITGDLRSAFDPLSITMYNVEAAWTTNGFSAVASDRLSALDKDYLRRAYPGGPPADQPVLLITGNTTVPLRGSVPISAKIRTRGPEGVYEYEDVTARTRFVTSNPDVVTGELGKAFGIGAGTAELTAEVGSLRSSPVRFTVVGATPRPSPAPSPVVVPSPSPSPGASPTGTPGATWTLRTGANSQDLFGVDLCDSTLLGTGLGGLQTSTTGVNWTSRTLGDTVCSSAFGNGVYLVVGPAAVYRATAPEGPFTSVLTYSDVGLATAFGGGKFLVMHGTALEESTDGTGYTPIAVPSTQLLRDGVYAAGRWIVVGHGGTLLTSTGGAWTALTSGTTEDLLGVAYGNGQFTAVGANGVVLTSTNGTAWTVRSTGRPTRMRAVAFGAGLFTAVGDDGVILTSDNGNGWTPRTSETTNRLYGVTFGAGRFVAVGQSGTVVTSP